MTSFVSEILSPGGAILLIPYIKIVISFLFCTTVVAFICGIARIHMAILSFLAGGLLISIHFFLAEYNRVLASKEQRAKVNRSSKDGEKTD